LRRSSPPFAAALFALGSGCTSSQVWFSSDDNLTQILTTELATATDTLDVAIYTFTEVQIRDALIDVMSRGVQVRVVMDPWEANDQIATTLIDAGVPLRMTNGYQGGIMHHKFAVMDEASVFTGSFNYTRSAAEINDENLILIQDKAVAGQFASAFSDLWARAEAP
jgi:phosphatidylserine/phosphatidylglycerophosphate/cardiolipin synthase-like enzyme